MTELKIRLFGKFSMEQGGYAIEGIQARKVQELFSFLLITRNRPRQREMICETLWENQPPVKSKKYLRQTLWRLQLALNNAASSAKPEIIANNDWIQLNPSIGFWLDIAEFEHAFNTFSDTHPRELTLEDFKTIRSVIDLYRGDLLDGWYQDWCLFERERFQILHLTLLDKLVQYCEIHGHYTMGLTYGIDILRQDHAYERTHRQMMRLYFLSGDRTQAIHQYQRCVAALHKELDIEPSESTKRLYEEICSDSVDASFFSGKEAAREALESTQVLSAMLNRLDHFSDELGRIRFRIEKEVTALESVSSPPK